MSHKDKIMEVFSSKPPYTTAELQTAFLKTFGMIDSEIRNQMNALLRDGLRPKTIYWGNHEESLFSAYAEDVFKTKRSDVAEPLEYMGLPVVLVSRPTYLKVEGGLL